MKIIDLLNKIANGEDVPKKIRFDNTYWNRICGEKNMYYENDYDDSLFVYFFRRDLTFTLNDEVEIIEENKPKTFNDIRESYGLPRIEDKKIEKIKILNCDNYVKKGNYETILTMQEIALDIQTLKHKVNKIIDKLNSMVE